MGAATTALIEVTRDPDVEVRYYAFTILAEEKRTDAILEAFRRGLEGLWGRILIISMKSSSIPMILGFISSNMSRGLRIIHSRNPGVFLLSPEALPCIKELAVILPSYLEIVIVIC